MLVQRSDQRMIVKVLVRLNERGVCLLSHKVTEWKICRNTWLFSQGELAKIFDGAETPAIIWYGHVDFLIDHCMVMWLNSFTLGHFNSRGQANDDIKQVPKYIHLQAAAWVWLKMWLWLEASVFEWRVWQLDRLQKLQADCAFALHATVFPQ